MHTKRLIFIHLQEFMEAAFGCLQRQPRDPRKFARKSFIISNIYGMPRWELNSVKQSLENGHSGSARCPETTLIPQLCYASFMHLRGRSVL